MLKLKLLDNTTIANHYYIHAVEMIIQAFCVIMIMMGVIMTKLNCSYVCVTSSTNSRPRRVATLVPADSIQSIPVTTAV